MSYFDEFSELSEQDLLLVQGGGGGQEDVMDQLGYAYEKAIIQAEREAAARSKAFIARNSSSRRTNRGGGPTYLTN
jgi:hypothetical protein